MPRPTGTQGPLFISSFQQGDESAFDCLFLEYSTALIYFANRYLADAQAAEDIVQDCFVLLWQRRGRLQHVSLIKSYLYTTVRNQCLKQLEKNRRKQLQVNFPTDEPSFEETLIASETANQLYQLIDTLTPALQKIIRLYYLEGKSNHEIAKELHIEPDTVIRQRLRAILSLRKTKISL